MAVSVPVMGAIPGSRAVLSMLAASGAVWGVRRGVLFFPLRGEIPIIFM